MRIPGLPSYFEKDGGFDVSRGPQRCAERLHKLATDLYSAHVSNPLLARAGFPGGSLQAIHDANTVCGALRANSVRARIRGKRKTLRQGLKSIRTKDGEG